MKHSWYWPGSEDTAPRNEASSLQEGKENAGQKLTLTLPFNCREIQTVISNNNHHIQIHPQFIYYVGANTSVKPPCSLHTSSPHRLPETPPKSPINLFCISSSVCTHCFYSSTACLSPSNSTFSTTAFAQFPPPSHISCAPWNAPGQPGSCKADLFSYRARQKAAECSL